MDAEHKLIISLTDLKTKKTYQKALLYSQKKKTKNEPDKEQDYIIL